jgi:hypothetical protein
MGLLAVKRGYVLRKHFPAAIGGAMSLTVPPDLLEQAQRGQIEDEDFIDCISTSLPYAWSLVDALAKELNSTGGVVVTNETAPPDEASRAQLLRLVGSDAMRGAIERHFGVKLAFQNCHRLALFHPEATAERAEFISPRSQILNQSPELVNC